MKRFVLLLAFFTTALMAETSLNDYRWEKRVLIFPQDGEDWEDRLDSEKSGLKERDLVIHFLDQKEGDYKTSQTLVTELRKMAQDRGKIYLIGKDGRTVLSWSLEDFSFKKLYASIDSMPMRQREMRER